MLNKDLKNKMESLGSVDFKTLSSDFTLEEVYSLYINKVEELLVNEKLIPEIKSESTMNPTDLFFLKYQMGSMKEKNKKVYMSIKNGNVEECLKLVLADQFLDMEWHSTKAEKMLSVEEKRLKDALMAEKRDSILKEELNSKN